MSEHHGETIEKVIRREGHSLTDLAIQIGVNRRSVYNWFLQRRLKPEIIVKIGKAIKHDFSVEFPQQFVSADFEVPLPSAPLMDTTNNEKINVWKEKYIDLLERYNFILGKIQDKALTDKEAEFNILFINDNRNEYNLELNNPPSDLFLYKCRKAGYKIKSINRTELKRDHTESMYENDSCKKNHLKEVI
jgi:lambda repressor-like predicted transcriptional regulator